MARKEHTDGKTFSCGPCRGYIKMTSSQLSQSRVAVVRGENWQLRRGTGREPRGRGTSAVGSRYQATVSED
jgi:hypothetical protein